jgi:ribonuclease HIII
MDDQTTRLDWLLNQIQLLDRPYQESSEGTEIYQEICDLVFEDKLYARIWSEPILNHLEQLFQTETPDEETFGTALEDMRQQTVVVREINDCFFGIIDANTTSQGLCGLLAKLQTLPHDFQGRLERAGQLEEIRNQDECTSEKVESFLEFLKDNLSLDLAAQEPIKGALVSLKSRDVVGKINALLVGRTSKAIAVPLHIKLRSGTGQVVCQVKSSEDFKDAVGRAQSAMRERGYLSGSEDIFYTLDLTDAHYQGSSLALAAAVAIHDVKQNLATDPYTAFTGDINLVGQDWSIKPVGSVNEKLAAAKRAGFRRVFIPRGNLSDIKNQPDIKAFGIDSLIDAFIQLRPNRQLPPSESLQGRKITVLQQYCAAHGWDLPPPNPIQAGVQFSIVPLEIPPLKVQIYDSGAHTPKTVLQKEYVELVSRLTTMDRSDTPIRPVNQPLTIQNSTLQDQIQMALQKLGPTDSRSEQYCKYSLKFVTTNETLTIKQYTSGKLLLQGSAGPLYKSILECVVPLYKIHFPKSDISVDSLLNLNIKNSTTQGYASTKELADVPLPHIGTDESGKGDYFGPMVIAGVLIDSTTETALKELGVKDSKALTDKRCKEMAALIRTLLPTRYQEIEILPERYNQLYEQFKAEGKNLNHLLAWGHARAIESLLQKESCSHAIADQFGDENYIRSKLMEKGKKLQLVQLPKGERYIAVAAASILARDRFLSRMESFRVTYKIEIPKGASDSVVNAGKQFVQTHGENALGKIAKLHHTTTEKIKGPKND